MAVHDRGHVQQPASQRRCLRYEQIPQSYVKSSQVNSSQVKFKMAVANPPPLVPLAGRASDREGRTRRNWHHCRICTYVAPSRGIEGMFIPIFLFLIIAAPQGFNIVPYSGSLQYGNETRLQAEHDGSDRGMRECCLYTIDGQRCRYRVWFRVW